MDEPSSERRQLIGSPLGEPDLNGNVLALDPTEVAEALPECVQVRLIPSRRSLVQVSYPPYLARLLRAGREWRNEDSTRDHPQECAPLHRWFHRGGV
jgi:hypothetical protein